VPGKAKKKESRATTHPSSQNRPHGHVHRTHAAAETKRENKHIHPTREIETRITIFLFCFVCKQSPSREKEIEGLRTPAKKRMRMKAAGFISFDREKKERNKRDLRQEKKERM
jgi:hypothetical protein